MHLAGYGGWSQRLLSSKLITGGKRFGSRQLIIIGRVVGALAVGAMIGFERSFHGRPAGFRTHALVCIASALLMIVTVYQGHWMHEVPMGGIQTDPTRMAQGIMTGIGFLGAGVIFKGLTVRGLTTAASIWITSAIGILIGIGFWFAAIVGAVATLVVLALFRLVEANLPSEFYAQHTLRFLRDSVWLKKTCAGLSANMGSLLPIYRAV
jgi:putative Mg2+ transporter-C (MgtC) family protein